MAIFTSLLGDFIANFAGDFMSDYLSNKLHSNKEQIVVQKSELLSVVESEIDKKISIMQMQQSEQYMEAELNHLRSQQNMVLEALLEYIQTTAFQLQIITIHIALRHFLRLKRKKL